jgi:hypothetical protein
MVVNKNTINLFVIENIRVNSPGFANDTFKNFTTEFNIGILLFDYNPAGFNSIDLIFLYNIYFTPCII